VTVDGDEARWVDPNLALVSTALGVLGMPGATAYFGMTGVADPAPGDTVVVSAAAGAVESVAGQLAPLAGARVIGTAGSDRKCAWFTDDLGFDAAVNYRKADDLGDALADACPDGVDIYFDNVGGPVTDAVWPLLNLRVSVAVCGQVSPYNATVRPIGLRKLHQLVQTRASVKGFLVFDYWGRYDEAFERIAGFVDDGRPTYREDIVEGFENAPDAFMGLFESESVGKQFVQVAKR